MNRRLLLLVLLLFAFELNAAEVKAPPTPAGKRLAALLQVFNSGDERRVRGFVVESYAASALQSRPAEERTAVYLQLYAETGGLQLRLLEPSSEYKVVVVTQARLTGEWYRLTLSVDSGSPNGIVGVTFRLVPPPPPFRLRRTLTDEQIVAETKKYAEKLSDAGVFGGVVLLARNGQPLLLKAYPWKRPDGTSVTFRTDERFGLASINKSFTAVAIAHLADARKLSFSDPIRQYLPEWPAQRAITIEQLLTHTSGLEPLLAEKDFEALRASGVTNRSELVRFLAARPPVGGPGEKFAYSNAGYMLLDGIIERVSGEPVQQYLKEQIFQPLGMTDTGDGMSTAGDMLKFAEGLRTAKLLSSAMTAKLMAPKVETEDPDVKYAYGLQVENAGDKRVVGHPGGGTNISAQLDLYPEDGYTVVVLSTRRGQTAQHVVNKLRELIAAHR